MEFWVTVVLTIVGLMISAGFFKGIHILLKYFWSKDMKTMLKEYKKENDIDEKLKDFKEDNNIEEEIDKYHEGQEEQRKQRGKWYQKDFDTLKAGVTEILKKLESITTLTAKHEVEIDNNKDDVKEINRKLDNWQRPN